MKFQVYTYFGRILANFEIAEDELHHLALERARVYCRNKEKSGVTCWVRLIR